MCGKLIKVTVQHVLPECDGSYSVYRFPGYLDPRGKMVYYPDNDTLMVSEYIYTHHGDVYDVSNRGAIYLARSADKSVFTADFIQRVHELLHDVTMFDFLKKAYPPESDEVLRVDRLL